jgi:hypothetical protein
MHGRCFGCGSTIHAKKEGNHDRNLCPYCKRTGHQEIVCMDKFLGQAKTQKAAAVIQAEEESMGLNTSDKGLLRFDDAESIALTSTTLAQIVEQQKNLTEQITAWRNSDF